MRKLRSSFQKNWGLTKLLCHHNLVLKGHGLYCAPLNPFKIYIYIYIYIFIYCLIHYFKWKKHSLMLMEGYNYASMSPCDGIVVVPFKYLNWIISSSTIRLSVLILSKVMLALSLLAWQHACVSMAAMLKLLTSGNLFLCCRHVTSQLLTWKMAYHLPWKEFKPNIVSQ